MTEDVYSKYHAKKVPGFQKFEEQQKNIAPWAKPLVLLVTISFFIYGFNRLIDYVLTKAGMPFMAFMYNSDVGTLTNTLGGMGEVVTSVLGLEVTVLAIIVQLAANKYSSDVMELFIENKVNAIIFALYVITAINAVLVTNTITNEFVTYFSISFTLLFIIISLLVVIPHFTYVFNFLRPNSFLEYVKKRIMRNISFISQKKVADMAMVKDDITKDIGFIGDIALNSVNQGDRAVPLLCLGLMRELLVRYIELKKTMPKEWFGLTGYEYFDPDFSSYSRFVMKRIEAKKIFLERKVFRLYEMLFDTARVRLRDVASGVLLNTELIASGAIKQKDSDALYTVFQFFNSYLRIAIRERDPRSAFNTLEHYRIVAEELLDTDPEKVEQISFFFKYYGQEANKNHVVFILETAAHDLCAINEMAYEKKVPNVMNLLRLFLTVDEPLEESKDKESQQKENSLIGVRLAQSKLAGFYIMKGEIEMARIIYEDMKIEPISRIMKMKEIMVNTREEEFWEITPRGVNFNFVEPQRRQALDEFFAWFGV